MACQQACVADGDAMRVVTEIVKEFIRAGEWRFGIHDPRLAPEATAQSVAGRRVGQSRDRGHGGWEHQTLLVIQLLQTVEELAAKDLAERADREQEASVGRQPL